jgi:hypothetical protein
MADNTQNKNKVIYTSDYIKNDNSTVSHRCKNELKSLLKTTAVQQRLEISSVQEWPKKPKLTLDHISARMGYIMHSKEHTWNVSLFQTVHTSSLVITFASFVQSHIQGCTENLSPNNAAFHLARGVSNPLYHPLHKRSFTFIKHKNNSFSVFLHRTFMWRNSAKVLLSSTSYRTEIL